MTTALVLLASLALATILAPYIGFNLGLIGAPPASEAP
jgi:hypothetical protein